jgi:hypothetical protein
MSALLPKADIGWRKIIGGVVIDEKPIDAKAN